jgi:leucine dehydrogenase
MVTPWLMSDFDGHERVHAFHDQASGLRAIIAIHSTHLGPAAGGVRFWRYANESDALTDALRLSRGMSYKNAMAGLALGGGKAVILAGDAVSKSPELLAAFAAAIESLGGQYVTAQDVGMTEADIQAIALGTHYVAGLPPVGSGAGGDPGPYTAEGVWLGIKAAARAGLGREDMRGVHIAIQGVGSVGGGVAQRAIEAGARLTLADADMTKAERLATALGAQVVPPDQIHMQAADIFSPNALGAILSEETIPALRAPIVAGGANNQLATPADAARLKAKGVLYAPDYVINAGGIINVGLSYQGKATRNDVMSSIATIPERLSAIWAESAVSGRPEADIADEMARRLIGRS